MNTLGWGQSDWKLGKDWGRGKGLVIMAGEEPMCAQVAKATSILTWVSEEIVPYVLELIQNP